MLAGCSRDAMSARREHGALAMSMSAKQSAVGKGGAKGGAKADADADTDADAEEPKDKAGAEAPPPPHPHPHPGDEGSLRRWEEILRSVDVSGGRWRPDMDSGGFDGE